MTQSNETPARAALGLGMLITLAADRFKNHFPSPLFKPFVSRVASRLPRHGRDGPISGIVEDQPS